MVENGIENKTNEVTLDDLKKCGCHIPSFKAKNIAFHQDNKTKIHINHSANIPFSLDLIKLFNLLTPKAFWKEGNQVCTNAICNVTFNEAYYEQKDLPRTTFNAKKKKITTYKKSRGVTLKTKKQLRDDLYENGFSVYDENKSVSASYDQYKRTSSKAKDGDSWFILNEHYQNMISWSRMGIVFPTDKEIDFAGLKAYESLPASSLVDTIDINPKHILIIDDVAQEVSFRASVTTLDQDKNPVVSIIDDYKCKHDLWDGQGLINQDIIPEEYKNRSMLLLRERYLKCAAFSTDLQGYFQKKCNEEGRDYETATTKNMFGDEILLKYVDLVLTPDSLKLLKFAQFVVDPQFIPNSNLDDKMNNKKRAFDYWVKNIELFGICKTEHESKFGTHQALTYQFINSLDISKEQLSNVLQAERDYVSMLKNDLAVFKLHTGNLYISNNKSFFMNLVAVNDDAARTPPAINYKNTVINDYIESLRHGDIKIDNADYCTLFSSPYSMLNAAYYGKYQGELIDGNSDIEDGAVEVYSPRFNDGQYICGWRNPMINQGNVCFCKNVLREEYKWFNMSENIIIIRGDSCFVEWNQGADEDSDTFCATSNEMLVEIARNMVQSRHYPIPINGIKIKNETPRYNNKIDSADIDNIIAESSKDIGVVCNWATLLNSLYWHYKLLGASQAVLDRIYKKSSMCSSLSQICIDKSKKFFSSDTCSVIKCLRTIYDLLDDNNEEIIQTFKIPVRKQDLDDEEAVFVVEQLEKLKSKEITQEQFDDLLDEHLIEYQENRDGDKIKKYIKKPYFPLFFQYLDTGDKRQSKDEKICNWNCPMNYLQKLLKIKGKKQEDDEYQLLDSFDYKKYEDRKPVSAVIRTPQLDQVDYRQIKKIFRMAYFYKNQCNSLWRENSKNYKENKTQEKKFYEGLLNSVRDMSITKDTIMQTLYLCYDPRLKCKKTSVFEVENSDGEKEEIRYSKHAVDVCGVLWSTHDKEFKKALLYNRGKITELVPILNGDTGDNDKSKFVYIWGKPYSRIEADRLA